jgi:hypothetical protein
MNLTSLASSALATTRSTFKGLAEAAVAAGDETAPGAETVAAAKPAEASEAKPKGIRRGTLLDAYA